MSMESQTAVGYNLTIVVEENQIRIKIKMEEWK